MKGSAPYSLDIQEDEEQFDIKKALSRYVRYWPWFLAAIFISITIGYFYLRYAPVVFESVAKIKILDDSKQMNISADPLSLLNGGSKINMSVLIAFRRWSPYSSTIPIRPLPSPS